MPVPVQRDPQVSRARLAEWLRPRLGNPRTLELSELSVPSSGFSSETLLFDVSWFGKNGRQQRELVARVAPTSHRVYPEDTFLLQYRIQEALAADGTVPVPALYGFEADPEILGAPFFVMERVSGRVPGDFPSYHREGWLKESSESVRKTLWNAALETLQRIHAIIPADLKTIFPGMDSGPSTYCGVRRELTMYMRHLDFFSPADAPLAEQVFQWLRSHVPDRTSQPDCLVWGDARIGNMVFSGDRVAAVLDWEMATVGPREMDVAWFLYLDRHLSEGVGLPRLSGLPNREQTVARYEELAGRTLNDLGYYDILAGFRFFLITARVTSLSRRAGIVPPDSDFPLHRNATALLRRTLSEYGVPVD
ncbi:phosphotransferase family protein [Streptomyces sp. NPDC050759]|uniref:phosphotransferase family protein n=1 Tax=Streptomyces sp. NPDC050759 TaxID=3365635 RepID=UPI00378DB8EB